MKSRSPMRPSLLIGVFGVCLATGAVASGAATFVSKSEFDPDRLVSAWASARG